MNFSYILYKYFDPVENDDFWLEKHNMFVKISS